MRDSDRILLDGLGLVTDLDESDWEIVVKAAETAGGIANLTGQPRAEVERAALRAREMVGHMDPVVKRVFTAQERRKLAEEGKAMPDGSYPIVTRGDLSNALQSIGRATNRAQVLTHIRRRAEDLDAVDMLPDWAMEKAVEPVEKHPGHPDQKVHGGGRRGGSAAPASSAGGASSPKAQEQANIKADEAGKESAKRMVEASNTATRSFDRSNIKRGDDDDMAIMEFHDEVGRIIEAAHELPAGHSRAKREIGKMDSWVQESVMIALRMTPTNKKVAIDSLRAITSEIKSLSQKVDEAWSGVTDMFAD